MNTFFHRLRFNLEALFYGLIFGSLLRIATILKLLTIPPQWMIAFRDFWISDQNVDLELVVYLMLSWLFVRAVARTVALDLSRKMTEQQGLIHVLAENQYIQTFRQNLRSAQVELETSWQEVKSVANGEVLPHRGRGRLRQQEQALFAFKVSVGKVRAALESFRFLSPPPVTITPDAADEPSFPDASELLNQQALTSYRDYRKFLVQIDALDQLIEARLQAAANELQKEIQGPQFLSA